MSWSPYKNTVIDFVRAHPGCTKYAVAARCAQSSRRSPGKQYYIVNTAIRNGWIVDRGLPSASRLYLPEQATLVTGVVKFCRPTSRRGMVKECFGITVVAGQRDICITPVTAECTPLAGDILIPEEDLAAVIAALAGYLPKPAPSQGRPDRRIDLTESLE